MYELRWKLRKELLLHFLTDSLLITLAILQASFSTPFMGKGKQIPAKYFQVT